MSILNWIDVSMHMNVTDTIQANGMAVTSCLGGPVFFGGLVFGV